MSKIITKDDLRLWDRIKRLNLINSITGYKPANLIGTRSAEGQDNLAIFSSVVHLGSNPALIGMITRPDVVERHTLENIRETGLYTINHIPQSLIRQAHWTSANWPREKSEFEALDIIKEDREDFSAPFVQDAEVKMAMHLEQEVPIKVNGTIMIIGRVQYIIAPSEAIMEDGALDYDQLATVAISGLSSYYGTMRITDLPYAKVENWEE